MRKMKRVIALTLAAVMTASLAACGQKPAEKAEETEDTSEQVVEEVNPNEEVTIRFSWWGGDSRAEATLKAVDLFMKKYPNIKVECEYGGWDGWTEKCATQLNAGTAPDLMQVNWNWLYQFSADGKGFADVEKLPGLDYSGVPETVLEKCRVNGKLSALPISTTGKCFYWNKTSFEKAGLELPKTIDDLMAAGPAFKEKLGEDAYPIALYQYERMILMLYYLEQSYGKDWVVDGKVNYTPEQVKEGLDWICKLEDEHVLPKIETLLGDGATVLEKNAKWSNGKYAGFYEYDSSIPKLIEALEKGQEVVLGEFITGMGENHKAGLTKISQCYAVTENSENKAAAALLMNFLLTDPEGVEAVGTQRGVVVNANSAKILEDKGMLDGIVYESNKAVLANAGFTFDPNFENSELKDTTGVYYEVFENISADHNCTADMAQYLIEETERVQAENPY